MFRNNIISREFEIILHLPFKIEHLEKGPPLPFAEYRYNQNSQIDSVFYNNGSYYIINSYNTRNWIIQSNSSSNNQFNYALEYYANGNISNQNINGDYKGNFSDTKEIRVSYTYDNSNRLIDAEPFSRQYFDLKGTYTYDADGNFLNLSRSYNGDEFAYEYYSGTNRLRKVTGESDQFTYDYNGNLKNDYFNNNTDIKYDHRNLITEITRVNELEDPPATYTTTYKYDEGGNRIQKTVSKDDGSTMEIIVNEYYVRDVSGKEIGIYKNDTLKFWNLWGNSNEGRITTDGTRYYYIKDHLGSIRAVLNENNELVEAIDYDPWGHIARYWSSTSSKYKFTGKERDNETGYDYFGARYYDSRIGNWTSTDPLFEKHIQWSPYNYVLRNPMILIDPDGRQIRFSYDENTRAQELELFKSMFPESFHEYFGVEISQKGEYLLNYDLLKTNPIETSDANYNLFSMILSLAKGPEITEVTMININYVFHVYDLEMNTTYPTDFETMSNQSGKNIKVYGFSLPSGNINNSQVKRFYSTRSTNEIFIRNDILNLEQAKTLGHELVHIYRYINFLIWADEIMNEELKTELSNIENQIEKNFNK